MNFRAHCILSTFLFRHTCVIIGFIVFQKVSKKGKYRVIEELVTMVINLVCEASQRKWHHF
jgi:phosphate starvation-inducible membrane PsiE